MRLTVVYNPTAGDKRWTKRAIEARLQAAGHEPRMVSTKGEWQAALKEETAAAVAAGGDGTVHKVVRELAGSKVRLGIVPLGTANNVASAFGHQPGDDPFARVEGWGKRERTLKIAGAEIGGKRLPLVEVMGAGAFARVLADKPTKKADPEASLKAGRKRLLAEVRKGPALEMLVDIDRERFFGEYVLLACLQLPSFGPSLTLAPSQNPGADTMTVVGVRQDQREEFAQWLAGEGVDPAAFRLGSGHQIELSALGPLHIDDRLLKVGKDRDTLAVESGWTGVQIMV